MHWQSTQRDIGILTNHYIPSIHHGKYTEIQSGQKYRERERERENERENERKRDIECKRLLYRFFFLDS